jgi:hypothetical protein
MATETTTATSAGTTTPAAGAAAGGIDRHGGFAALVGAAVADAVKPMNEKIAKLEAAPAAAAPAAAAADQAAPKALTAEDVDKLVEKRLAAQQQSAQAQAQRDAFLAEKLKDLPAAYRSKLGTTRRSGRTRSRRSAPSSRSDFAAAGGKPADVGADKPGGAKPAEAVDFSKLSPTQLIAQGLKTAVPQRGAAIPVAPPATAPAVPAAPPIVAPAAGK